MNEKTCFDFHIEHNLCCNKQNCRSWIQNSQNNNCIIIASHKGPKTLQEIGEIFNITRMRVCQIEKNIIKKLSNELK
jgi:DNA-directed RNA polymerase specialized sigma subunit